MKICVLKTLIRHFQKGLQVGVRRGTQAGGDEGVEQGVAKHTEKAWQTKTLEMVSQQSYFVTHLYSSACFKGEKKPTLFPEERFEKESGNCIRHVTGLTREEGRQKANKKHKKMNLTFLVLLERGIQPAQELA